MRVVVDESQPFTRIPNSALRDERLSFRARGLLAYLLSHKDGFPMGADEASQHAAEGREATRTAMKELIAAGYVGRVRRQGEGGRWVTELVVYSVAQQPTPGRPTPENPTVGRPTPGEPTPGNPTAGRRSSADRSSAGRASIEKTNKKTNKKNREELREDPPTGGGATKRAPGPEHDQDVDRQETLPLGVASLVSSPSTPLAEEKAATKRKSSRRGSSKPLGEHGLIAKRVVDGWWAKQDPRPAPQRFWPILKIVEGHLQAGWDERQTAQALDDVAASGYPITITTFERALRQRKAGNVVPMPQAGVRRPWRDPDDESAYFTPLHEVRVP